MPGDRGALRESVKVKDGEEGMWCQCLRQLRVSAISQGSRGKLPLCREGEVGCTQGDFRGEFRKTWIAIAQRYQRCSVGRFVVASESASTQGSMGMRRGGVEGIMLDSG